MLFKPAFQFYALKVQTLSIETKTYWLSGINISQIKLRKKQNKKKIDRHGGGNL